MAGFSQTPSRLVFPLKSRITLNTLGELPRDNSLKRTLHSCPRLRTVNPLALNLIREPDTVFCYTVFRRVGRGGWGVGGQISGSCFGYLFILALYFLCFCFSSFLWFILSQLGAGRGRTGCVERGCVGGAVPFLDRSILDQSAGRELQMHFPAAARGSWWPRRKPESARGRTLQICPPF